MYFLVTPESTWSDGGGSRSIPWLAHKRVRSPFSRRGPAREAGSFVIDFFFPPFSPRLVLRLLQRLLLILLGVRWMEETEQKERQRKGGQLHLQLPKQVYHCLGALSRLVHPLTWNAPMRQSGAADAWRLAQEVREGGAGGRREWVPRPEMRGDRLSRASVDAPLKASAPADTAGGGTRLLEKTRRNRPFLGC